MKKIIQITPFSAFLYLVILVFPLFAAAQNMSVHYEFIDNSLGETDPKSVEREYRLDILGNKSLFRTESRRKSDSLQNQGQYGNGYRVNINQELYFAKDFSTQKFSKHFVFSLGRDKFFITDFKELQWKISDETQKIGIYNCQKAEVDFSGRHWIAWFCKEIALSEGPYYFHGLPGLILKMEDNQNNFSFTVTKIEEMKTKDLFERDLGKEISWEQYKKILRNFYDDPMFSLKAMGTKVHTDDGKGGTKEVDYREFTKGIQKNLAKHNNPIELDQKVEFK